MRYSFRLSVVVALASVSVASAQTKFKMKVEKSSLPKELSAGVAKVLDDNAVKLLDQNGKLVGEFWFRKQLPASPLADPAAKLFGYRDLRETEILAAVRFHRVYPDYRRQKVKAGVYTLRMGFQPVDGNHIGASKHEEFCVAIAADKDTKADPMDTKAVVRLSMKSIKTGHPAIFMLFPPMKKAPDAPKLVAEEADHWYVAIGRNVVINGKNVGSLGLCLGVAGAAEE